jgi:hypothetical protein
MAENNSIQKKYVPASQVCVTLNTVVPTGMANEQATFNEKLKALIDVDKYVAEKLKYKSVEDLCYGWDRQKGEKVVRFAKEQIDAIATAIYNYENSEDGIILADQTGIGKGRVATGILRYAILTLNKVPIFITEKEHLVNDIYRDFYDIGLDAGVPMQIKSISAGGDDKEYSDDELEEMIIDDIKSDSGLRTDSELADYFELEWLVSDELKKPVSSDYEELVAMDEESFFEMIEETKQQLIEDYRSFITENGAGKVTWIDNPNYERDMIDAISEGRMLLTPFRLNKTDVRGKNGSVIYPKISDKEYNDIFKKKDVDAPEKSLTLPPKYKLITLTYSQLRTSEKNGKVINKVKLVANYASNGVIVMDEAHNAAGINPAGVQSQTGVVVFNLVERTAMTMYVSATFAKKAESMPLYALKTSIRESGIDKTDMITAFKNGGNALQEAVSAELTKNGQLLRREKLIEGESEYYYENENGVIGQNQLAKLDRVAELIYGADGIYNFSKTVAAVIQKYKKDHEGIDIKHSGGIGRLQFLLFNFFVVGIKINQTVEKAVEHLNSGRKTVIAIASTMESALNTLSKSFMSYDDKYVVGDSIQNDFVLYVAHLLQYTMQYNEKIVKPDDKGNMVEVKKKHLILTDESEIASDLRDKLMPSYSKLLDQILIDPTGLPNTTGIPISPIDMIKKKIKKHGFSIEEITGRTREVTFDGDQEAYGKVAKRIKNDTQTIINNFNNNITDCLIINQSGATGISMHAVTTKDVTIVNETPPTSLKNKREVKARAMVITQMELDINKEVQKLGRINRTGQKYEPAYTYIVSAIPSEARLSAMMQKKLKSLSANVSADQDQSAYLFSADDFFSDVAIKPFNETLVDIGMRGVKEINSKEEIYEFTKTLYFRDANLQRDFYETFAKKLKKEIETLISQNLYVGKMSYKNYQSETISIYPFYVGDKNARTSFGGHGFIEHCKVTQYADKNVETDIKHSIKDRFRIKEEYGDGYTDYPDQKRYSVAVNGVVEKLRKEITEHKDRTIKEGKLKISGIEAELARLEIEVKGFAELETALETKKELDSITDEIKEKSASVMEFLNEGKMDDMQRATAEVSSLQEKKKVAAEKFEKYKPLLERQSEYKTMLGVIKDYGERKELQLKNIQDTIDFADVRYTTCTLILQYVNSIGKICEYKTFREDYTWDGSEKIYNYELLLNEPVVLAGVKFPNNLYDLTLGRVDLTLVGVENSYSPSLSPIHKVWNEEYIKQGRKNTDELTVTSNNYDDNGAWNMIAGKVDTSYKEDKFIVNGSILKTFILSRNSGLNGFIIKYNTNKNVTRVGLEIPNTNVGTPAQPQYVYDNLLSRYSDETALSYPVYFDCTPENFIKYIVNYAYRFYVGEIYDAIKDGQNIRDTPLYLILKSAIGTGLRFQLASNKTTTIFRIAPNGELGTKIRELIYGYENGYSDYSEIDRDEFVDNLECAVISDSVAATNTFASLAKNKANASIDGSNYQFCGKNAMFPDITPYRGKNMGTFLTGVDEGRLFLQTFPINITNISLIRSFLYSAQLTLSMNEMIRVIEELYTRKKKPTFATSSKYFKYLDEPIFVPQQDDVEVIKTDENGDEIFDTPLSEEEQESIDLLIDNLVNILQ